MEVGDKHRGGLKAVVSCLSMSAVSVLKVCPLFKGFTDTGLGIIASAFKERSFAKDSVLFEEDAPARSMLILGSGRVALRTQAPSGEEIALGEMGPADYLGELCLVQTGRRMCTAVAVEPVSAWELGHGDFQELLAQKPQAGTKLLLAVFRQFAAKLSENRELLRAAVQRK